MRNVAASSGPGRAKVPELPSKQRAISLEALGFRLATEGRLIFWIF